MDVIQKAVQLVEDGHVDEAIAILSNFSTTCSDDEKVVIAELYIEWGFFDEASKLLEQLLHTHQNNSELKIMLASIYTELEQDEKALDLLEMIEQEDPVYIHALLQLADLYESQGLYEVAERKLLAAKEIEPDEIIIDFALGELLFSIGQYNRAITFYEKVLQHETEIIDININERVAECLAALGQYESALLHFESINSENPDTLFKHGLIAYYANRSSVAIQIWNNLLERDPYYHTVYVNLGYALYEEGQFNDAYDIVKKGLKVDEYNKEMYLLASKITYAQGEFEQSEQYARQAIELDSDYKEAVLFLVELFKNNDEYEEIVELIKSINKLNIYDPDYEWELARAHYELESYDDALQIYKDIYNDLKNNSVYLKEYGYFLTEEGLFNDAIDVFSTYLLLVPDDDEVRMFLERLETSNN